MNYTLLTIALLFLCDLCARIVSRRERWGRGEIIQNKK